MIMSGIITQDIVSTLLPPVTLSELTDDDEFWKGCETCPYYDILIRTKRSHCLCTGMVKKQEKSLGELEAQQMKTDKIEIK